MEIMHMLKPAADKPRSYAHDELGMAAMRLQVRAPGEAVSEEEERYRLLPAQLPVRNAVGYIDTASLSLQPATACHATSAPGQHKSRMFKAQQAAQSCESSAQSSRLSRHSRRM